MDELLTPAQLAERLGVTEKTLTDWRYKGKGPRYIKPGKKVQYREASVNAWLAEQEEVQAARRRAS